jgi:hypothetical protein
MFGTTFFADNVRTSGIGGIDSFTKLMLHLDGTNGSTTFTDSSLGTPKTATVVGSATIGTAQSKFGGASGNFVTAGSYLNYADHADFDVSTGNFTLDFWGWCAAWDGSQIITGKVKNGAAFSGWYLGTTAGRNLTLYTNDNTLVITSSGTLTNSAWNHIAIVTSSGTTTMYINGVSQGTTANQLQYFAAISLGVGGVDLNKPGTIWIDEYRWSKGVARWTTNFTPPSSPYST